jgi:hypothetical protein
MVNRICITTPAGESHAVEVDDKGAPNHAVHTGLRLGVAQLMHWVDMHVDWKRPDKPEIKTPFHGDGDWIIKMHPSDRTCDICKQEGIAQ